jgi:hypothetical protein
MPYCPIQGKCVYLRNFEDEQDAARAVDVWLLSQGRAARNFTEEDAGVLEGGDAITTPQ